MITVVIPIYNEEENIDKLVESLKVFPKETEIIFSDASDRDFCRKRLEELSFKVVKADKGRGRQIIKGIEETRGDKILVLHADSYFKENPCPKIEECLDKNPVGAFKLSFEEKSLYLRIVAFNSNLRIKLRNIAFGDQAMFFTRTFYNKIGGFKAISLMEDYDFSIRLKKAGIKISLVDTYVYSSARRFLRNGITRTILNMQKCQYLFRKGVDPDEIRKLYK